VAVYSSAANNDAGNLAGSPTVIHCIIPHASVGMSLLEWYATQDETGAIGGRMALIAATGGTSSEALTPELLNTRSAAAGFTTQTKFSVEPSTSGNRLIVMAYDANTTRVAHRRWLTPNPRYPIYRDAGDPKLCLNIETSAQVTFTRYLVIAEDKKSSFDVIKGRRGRTRGYFIIQDEARNFGGVSTAPKSSAGANAYISLQVADWDTAPPSYNPAVFLNLLNAGGGGAIQYTQDVDGTLTSSGSLVKQTGKILAGTMSSTGLLVKQTGKILAGSMASSGAIQKQTGKVLAGSMASSGAIVKQTQKPLSGSMASSGALVKQTQKVLGGTLTSAGALVKQAQKVLAGALTSSGLLVKQTNKILAGTLTSSGALTAFKVALISLAGTLT
jgi:hypothetical protein